MESGFPSPDLLAQARGGDLSAFGRLVRQHEGWLRAMLRGRLVDWATADDLAQEVFITAFRKIHDLREGASLEAWLRGIAMNLLRNHQRKRREEYIGGNLELDLLLNGQPLPFETGPPSLDALTECLRSLGSESRQLLEKRYLHGQTVREISAETGRGYSALTMMFHRLREALATCVENKLEHPQP